MTKLDAAREQVADAMGVSVDALDAFVLRRVDDTRMVHLGGVGRAVGWAGVIEIDVSDEPLICEAWTSRRPVSRHAPDAMRVFGPYWARSAKLVPLPPDHLVVFGAPNLVDAPAKAVIAHAELMVAQVGEVSPAKRLGDELEVLHAVRRIAHIAESTVQQAADRVARVAAEALSCEVGAVWIPEADVLAVASIGPEPTGIGQTNETARALARVFADRATLPHCQQANDERPLPPPFGADSSVLAWYAVPIDGPPDGLLLLCHTTARPRGFTSLCQQVGRSIAEAAATPLATALAQERLTAQLAAANIEARRDALTGLANRRVWDEVVAELAADRRRHEAAVVVLDVDGLKDVNDRFGHRAGDDLLRAIAGALESSIRQTDIAARLGGDEFAALLRDVDARALEAIVDRLRAAITSLPASGDRQPSASIGWALVADRGIDEALRAADDAMYATKRSRPRQHPHRPSGEAASTATEALSSDHNAIA